MLQKSCSVKSYMNIINSRPPIRHADSNCTNNIHGTSPAPFSTSLVSKTSEAGLAQKSIVASRGRGLSVNSQSAIMKFLKYILLNCTIDQLLCKRIGGAECKNLKGGVAMEVGAHVLILQ